MGNGVVNVAPHDFAHLSHWHYQLQTIKTCDFGFDSTGITFVSHFIELRSAILKLLYAYRRTTPERTFSKADHDIKDDAVITHPQRIVLNAVLIDQRHKFKYLMLQSAEN